MFGNGKITKTGSMICTECGTQGEPRTITNGSFMIEVILWLCFIVPGVIYTLWRLTTRHGGCPSCGSSKIINVNSPIGKKLLADVSQAQ